MSSVNRVNFRVTTTSNLCMNTKTLLTLGSVNSVFVHSVVNLLTFKHIGSTWTATIPVRMSLSIQKVIWRVMA